MRIVHVCPVYYPVIGGGQSHMKELSEGLVRRGHDVTVLTRNSSDGFGTSGDMNRPILPEQETINGVTVKRFIPLFPRQELLNLRGSGLVLRTFHSDYLNMWAEGPHFPSLVAEIVRLKPDLVAVLGWFLPAVPYHVRLAKMLKQFSFVGIPLFHTDQEWAYNKIYPRLLSHCDAVLVSTDIEKQFVHRLVPGKPEVHVVGVGVSPAQFAAPQGERIRARYGLRDFPIVGYVGKRIPHKGVGALAQAMKIVWKSDAQVRLVLAGPFAQSEHERRFGEELLGDLSPDERSRIVQIGPFSEDDKPSLFDAFDIFAMPSSESFGIVYLEAWMCRKPVIGLRTGAIPYVIRDGIDGLLVNPGDPASLASAILDLVRDPKKRQRMGQAGYEKTLAQFTWGKITDKVESIYSTITDHSKPVKRAHLRPEIP